MPQLLSIVWQLLWINNYNTSFITEKEKQTNKNLREWTLDSKLKQYKKTKIQMHSLTTTWPKWLQERPKGEGRIRWSAH